MADYEPPKILGVTPAGSELVWNFGPTIVRVSPQYDGTFCGIVNDRCIAHRLTATCGCIAAIERELLAIRAAIPEPAP